MLPVIAIVGRPNVGKSTLFNCLTKTRDALVVDLPGTTRDRKYGQGKVGNKPYILIDTGGIGAEEDTIDDLMTGQSWQAIEESDTILFVVDAKSGLNSGDEVIAKKLRTEVGTKNIILVVNKIDGLNPDVAALDFYKLGFEKVVLISSSQKRGVKDLASTFLADFIDESLEDSTDTQLFDQDQDQDQDQEQKNDPYRQVIDDKLGIKMAIVGRPNVGKSTLVNRVLGEERVIAFDAPGTTRDSIYIPFERRGKKYTVIDTAGIRKKSKIKETVEKFSIVKALQAIEDSNVVVLVIDANEGISDQDLTLLDFSIDAGKAIVIAINKWDGLDPDIKDEIKKSITYKLVFAKFAKIHFISALHGTGVGDLFRSINKAYSSATKKHSTNSLTAILEKLVGKFPPPMVSGRRIKLRYAHPGGYNPPRIIIHGNQTDKIPGSYKRYLINNFLNELELEGTPIKVEFKTSDNPYKDKVNKLTSRQIAKKRRLMKHVKKGKK